MFSMARVLERCFFDVRFLAFPFRIHLNKPSDTRHSEARAIITIIALAIAPKFETATF